MNSKSATFKDYGKSKMTDCDSCDFKVGSICSANSVEEGGSRLVECLRGRLLAERQASNAAKQDNDLLRKRVMELEIMLKEEIELRDRAENKLRFLHKKLNALLDEDSLLIAQQKCAHR